MAYIAITELVKPMDSMNITLPNPMKDWVKKQVSGGQYASVSDYVRDLIRRDQNARDKRDALIRALIEGEESGISRRTKDEIIAEAKSELKYAPL